MFEKFWRYMVNTLIVGTATTAVVLVISVLGAFGLSRYRFHGRDFIKYSAIWGYLFPPIILVFPYASLLKGLCSLGNSVCSNGGYGGLILTNCAFCLPFGLWLMIQYFCAIPQEFDKAAAADGARWDQALWYVLIPRALPGIAAVGMFTFILSWNDVVLSAVLARGDYRTIAAGVKESIFDTDQRSYSTFAAASLGVAMLAIIIFGLLQSVVDSRMRAEAETQN
jgi:multiple sugar transport system permease protein